MFQQHHLLRRRLGRVLGGVALTAALSLASPLGAQAAGLWPWLEGLLADRIGTVMPHRTPPPPAASPSPAARARKLACPLAGCPKPSPTQGPGTDPDGKP